MLDLRIRMPESLGCSVAATAVIWALLKTFPDAKIVIVSKFTDLFRGMTSINIDNAPSDDEFSYDVDLRSYTSRRPHNTPPFRPSYIHMIEMAEQQLSVTLPKCVPKLHLEEEEINWARQTVKCRGKRLVWYQSVTNSLNRDWPAARWRQVAKMLNRDYLLVDLSSVGYSLRQSLAVASISFAGICLDSFLVHGSWAVGAQNVLVLLGSSRAQCVTYPGQTILYRHSRCPVQPCGMHGYTNGCKMIDDPAFVASPFTACLFDNFICMNAIKVEEVFLAFRNMIAREQNPKLLHYLNSAAVATDSNGRILERGSNENTS